MNYCVWPDNGIYEHQNHMACWHHIVNKQLPSHVLFPLRRRDAPSLAQSLSSLVTNLSNLIPYCLSNRLCPLPYNHTQVTSIKKKKIEASINPTTSFFFSISPFSFPLLPGFFSFLQSHFLFVHVPLSFQPIAVFFSFS